METKSNYRYEFIETPIAHVARTHKMIEGAGGLQAYINRPRGLKHGGITLAAIQRRMRKMEEVLKGQDRKLDGNG